MTVVNQCSTKEITKMKCKMCSKQNVGNSKYCQEHKLIAKQKWIEMIQSKSVERDNTEQRFKMLFAKADQEGKIAAKAVIPAPMIVQEHENMLDDNSPVAESYFVSEGVCGFAWIHIYPGNSPAANYAKKHLGAGKSYRGGIDIWVSDYGQSMTRKEAYAHAYVSILHEGGIENAYAISRMD